MRRRSFMKAAFGLSATVTAVAAISALAAPGRPKVKITDVQVKRIRVIKELGKTVSGRAYRVGGDLVTLIHTDAGLTGIGPGVTPAMLGVARQRLVGADPLDVQSLSRVLFNPGGTFNSIGSGANLEIALWDLVGKMLEIPLYKLWGGTHGKLMPYASQWSTGTPEERARMAQTVRAQNWRAIKFRSHFPTMKEDVALIEQTRRLMGDEFVIMTDANQAQDTPDGGRAGGVRWDYKRELDTAREYARLGLYFLEEPLPRWDFDQLAELRRASGLRLAGGEASTGLHEYRGMLEKGSLDIIQFEISVIGPTTARQVATLAAAYDKPCIAHVGFGPGVFCAGHFNASLQNAVFLGPNHGTGPTWEVFFEPPALDIGQIWSVYENSPRIDKDGYMQLPDAPGLGVSIRPELLQDA
jgi:D-galactarolactone cycloisomerase